jgi:pre-60S factor REI1
MPKGSNPETASFTCNTCGVKFINAELQRQHMKTEWHRYNLKRRVASLPSISSELFAEKIISLKNMAKNENEDEYGFYVATRKKKKNSNGDKQVTKKFLKSQQNRGRAAEIVSATTAVRSVSPASSIASEFSQFSINDSDYHEVESVETGSEINYTEESEFSDLGDELYSDEDGEDHDHDEEESEDETECIPITHCFYCGANNHEIENNIKHMFNRHGLYIPERSFLVDVE